MSAGRGTMRSMSNHEEVPTADQIPDYDQLLRVIARRVHDETYDKVIALLQEAIDQVQEPHDTFRGEEAELGAMDAADELLAIEHLSPQAALFAVGRASAAMIINLCQHLNIDPNDLLDRWRKDFARAAAARSE